MAPPRTYLASTYLAIDLKSFYASVECVVALPESLQDTRQSTAV